ncbi:MAG: LacI family DNA-binding transcriptional regulator [Granulosicoccus sp.]
MANKSDKKQTVSLSQIAEAVGVSKMTVSRVIRNADGYSEATREKVMREIERHGYQTIRLGANTGHVESSTVVGVCVPALSGYLMTQTLESLGNTLERFGFQMMLGCHNNQLAQEESWLKQLVAWRPAGVLLCSKYHSQKTTRMLREADLPVLEFWELNTSPIRLSVGFNEYDAGFEMSQHARFKGYENAALLLATQDSNAVSPARVKGFETGFQAGDGQVVHTEILNDQPSFYAGYYGTELLFNHGHSFDMIYYMNDDMAIGGLAWCQRKGIRVPEDVGIAGWGGHEAASILPLRLTTTQIPVIQIGKLSAEQLVRSLKGEETQNVSAVPARLVDGDTV